jgi:hypothetical protein
MRLTPGYPESTHCEECLHNPPVPHAERIKMPQTAPGATALKEPPAAAPAQARTRSRPRTAGRHRFAQPPARPPAHRPHPCAGPRAGPDQRTPPNRGARHQPPAPMLLPRLPLPTHAARVHPERRHGPGTHALACAQGSPRKHGFPRMATVRAALREQERGQCTWHWIGRLSS